MTSVPLPYQCVVFDAVGTLIHARPSVAEVYCAAAARQGVHLSVAELKQRFQQTMSARVLSSQTSEEQERQFWRETVQQVIGDVPDPEGCFQELYEHFGDAAAWQLDQQAVPTLQQLRQQGLLIALASNFDERLMRLTETMPGLGDFHEVVISSQIGWRKPHPEFFRTLLRRLDLPAERVLMVGDDFELDILPARAMGLAALHLQKGTSGESVSPGSAAENGVEFRTDADDSRGRNVPRLREAPDGEPRSISSLREVLKWCRIEIDVRSCRDSAGTIGREAG